MHRILCLLCSGSILYGLYHIRWVVFSHFEAVYDKSLRLSCWSLFGDSLTMNQIIYHMSVDAQNLMSSMQWIHFVWSIPYQVSGFLPFWDYICKSLCLSGWSLSGGSMTMGLMTNHMSVDAQSLPCSGSISYGLYHIRWVVFSHFEAHLQKKKKKRNCYWILRFLDQCCCAN